MVDLTVVVAILGVAVPAWQFFLVKRSENRRHAFETYHRLIDDLVGANGTAKLDRQIAIIFELRNYLHYYEVSLRILKGLRDEWKGPEKNKRLIEEMNLTIIYLESKITESTSCIKKFFSAIGF
jgi:hypothetical protein